MKIILIFIISLILICLFINKTSEGFNDRAGIYCFTCKNKNRNSCMRCFNCIWAVNKDGSSGCIGGDVNNGPYNKENVARWYVRDPFHHVTEMNNNYKMSYGPKQGNRVI